MFAQHELGTMYEFGHGVAQSDEEAMRLYKMAANAGMAGSQSHLGVVYENGLCCAQSDIEAARWYRKAADQGYAEAQYNLAVMYEGGRGVAQSKKRQHACLKKLLTKVMRVIIRFRVKVKSSMRTKEGLKVCIGRSITIWLASKASACLVRAVAKSQKPRKVLVLDC